MWWVRRQCRNMPLMDLSLVRLRSRVQSSAAAPLLNGAIVLFLLENVLGTLAAMLDSRVRMMRTPRGI